MAVRGKSFLDRIFKQLFAGVFAVGFFLLPCLCAAAGLNYDLAKKKMEPALWQLINSDNPRQFADRHNIEIKDGAVRVVIEMHDGDGFNDIQKHYIITGARRHKNLIEGYVLIKDLEPLAREPSVRFVRRPVKFFKLR